jgi:hypothetical protein
MMIDHLRGRGEELLKPDDLVGLLRTSRYAINQVIKAGKFASMQTTDHGYFMIAADCVADWLESGGAAKL